MNVTMSTPARSNLGGAVLLLAFSGAAAACYPGAMVTPPAQTNDASCATLSIPNDALLLPVPTGSYGVARGGRRTLIDISRAADPTVPLTEVADAGADAGDGADAAANPLGRALSVEVWYPTDADPCPIAAPAPYMDDAEGAVVDLSADPHFYKRVRTHAAQMAPFATDGTKRPLLLFSPGYSAFPRMYTAFIEDLVSHGYVVATITHPFWAPITIYADGSSTLGTHTHDPAALQDESEVWLSDARFVLDGMIRANDSDPLHEIEGHVDVDKIGIFGHSFGGAAAMNLITVDPRVKAAIALDAVRHIDPGWSCASFGTPFLLFESSANPTPLEYVNATGPAYLLGLDTSTEGSFIDFDTMLTQLGAPDPTSFGQIAASRAIAITNAYDLAFFDKHLAGKSAPLLDGPSAAYPELLFAKKP